MSIPFQRVGLLAGLSCLPAALFGCTAPGGVPVKGSIRYFPDVSEGQALVLAENALRQYGFRIQERDEDMGRLRTYPLESTMAGGTGRIRDAVKYTNRVRRVAEVYLLPRAQGVRVKCRVMLQRLDTGDYTTFGREHLMSDVPTETPIDQDGGTLARQNEVWTDVRSDRQLQQQILTTLAELLGRPAAAGSGAT